MTIISGFMRGRREKLYKFSAYVLIMPAMPDKDWKKKLTKEQYHILREKGTEFPFTGKFYLHKEKGFYVCAGCGQKLFSSDAKFDSGCGWPSFFESMPETVELRRDESHGMVRTEVTCRKCGGHLGHVFDDGPISTGKRYCINSAALEFRKKK